MANSLQIKDLLSYYSFVGWNKPFRAVAGKGVSDTLRGLMPETPIFALKCVLIIHKNCGIKHMLKSFRVTTARPYLRPRG